MLALLLLGAAGHVTAFRPAASSRGTAFRSREARCSPRMADRAWRGTRDLPQKLLLQASIQAQLSYAQEFKNELMGRWLCSFLGHEHLRVARTGDYGTGRILYCGLDGGLRCSWSGYLRTMLSSGTQTYDVQYHVGTADIGHWPKPEGGEAPTSADGTPYPWAAAAASRRANPYLQKAAPQLKTYTEVIEPRRVARGLMGVREQLAQEWEEDLRVLAQEGEDMRAWFCEQQEAREARRQAEAGAPADGRAASHAEMCNVQPSAPPSRDDSPLPARSENGGAQPGSAAHSDPPNPTSAEPAAPSPAGSDRLLAHLFARGKSNWSEASTPFRAQNFDLLQRALAREAALFTVASLRESPSTAATAAWLLAELDLWLPAFEAPSRRYEGGHFVLSLMAQGPSMASLPDGSMGLRDPARAVDELLSHRARIASEWVEVVRQTAQEHAELLREDLTKQLNAEISQGDLDA